MNFFTPKVHIGLLYLGILGLMFFALTVNVIVHRWKFRVPIGGGQNQKMTQIIRMHGHFAEYVPLLSLMLVILEINRTPSEFLHFLWISLVLSRVFHAWGLYSSHLPHLGRFLGMTLTAIVLLGSSTGLLISYTGN
ncbi:MAPEG family protein [Bdellovibrio reynosensis]|uniref:MAPEG family protein n=1 Tax=Bdellovibrio reynosensis TaxID=2835041 RepID=A0ABY4CCW0_9BACT|nr:MAPEG family protein [Bdellovibrio reynosensis]UOF02795.1 MAPEG family protein [Bdellovibrio reynosensis]